jgi:hypothetical protein
MSNESYAETIAALREEARTRQLQNIQMQARELRESTWENERLALEAHQTGDAEMARAYADMANESEQRFLEVAAQLPQQQGQQIEPWVAELTRQHQAFLDRSGQAGIQAIILADGYATRPRTNSNNPAVHGCGLRRGTAEYYSQVKNLLELYARDYGLHYDANENSPLTPKEAAAISNVSDKDYAEGERKMYSEGRDSASEQGALWDRETG